MAKIQKHIEIVRSSIPELSSMSTKSARAVQEALKELYERVGISIVNDLSSLKKLVALQPDLVFIGMKYVPGIEPGSKIWVSGYLKSHAIAHTGSPERAVKYEQNKPFAKQLLIEAGIKTSPYLVFSDVAQLEKKSVHLTYPLFVKPSNLGAGKGVDEHSIVHNLEALKYKVGSIIQDYQVEALVEEYLPGREFSVAVLKKAHSDELMAMPIEMHPGADIHGDKILSFALKSGALETPISAVSDTKIKIRINTLALKVFRELGARDYGRIDIKLDNKGVPTFLEANLIPSIINDSGNFQKATLLNKGISYEEMLERIVNLAFERVEPNHDVTDEVDIVALFGPNTAVEVR